MSTFNTALPSTRITNVAGGDSYKQTSKLEFVSILLTNFLEDTAYRTMKNTLSVLDKLMNSIADKKFIAQASFIARTKFGMRSVSHYVASYIATLKAEPWMRSYFDKIIYRADDMLEIAAAFRMREPKKCFPQFMKKGFNDALHRQTEYSLAKYSGQGKEWNMRDIVNICHPKYTDALTKLMKGTLASPETWEVALTRAGQTAKDADEKKSLTAAAWTVLLQEKKLGYFALLRNVRNIIQQAPNMVHAMCLQLTDEVAIRKSLVLPFRYMSAIDELMKMNEEGVREAIIAVATAMDISLCNIPHLSGKTLVMLDDSGSMQGKPIRIGSIFAAALVKANNADLITFSNDATFHQINVLDSTITIASNLVNNMRASSTNFVAPFISAVHSGKKYDRIIILSDMQGWVADQYGVSNPRQAFAEYKRVTNSDPFVFSFDLQNYGTMMFPERNVCTIAGWSDKILEILPLVEKDNDALLHLVEEVVL